MVEPFTDSESPIDSDGEFDDEAILSMLDDSTASPPKGPAEHGAAAARAQVGSAGPRRGYSSGPM